VRLPRHVDRHLVRLQEGHAGQPDLVDTGVLKPPSGRFIVDNAQLGLGIAERAQTMVRGPPSVRAPVDQLMMM
jgi:hypothetical protein